MRLKQLKLTNFRNYEELDVDLNRRVVILVGDNAQGKTNFLEGVYLFAITKSFRLRSDANLVGQKKEFSRLAAQFEKGGQDAELEIVIKRNAGNSSAYQKIIKLNGVPAPARKVLGSFLAVLFCPEDINLIKTVPSGRRRFLDILGCQVSAEYCRKLVEYNKIVKNRNQVLLRVKQGIGEKGELIFWNNELVDKGGFVIKFRQDMMEELNNFVKNYYQSLSSKKLSCEQGLTLHYLSSFHFDSQLDLEGIRLKFRSELLKKQKQEIERQQTFIGPHRDDFHFFLRDRNIIYQGSRGEFRSIVLALKLAELDFLEAKIGERPVLLLDDVFSELDNKRQRHTANLIQDQQVFITTTDPVYIASSLRKNALIFKVRSGQLKKWEK